jgi:hypothetical protein
MDFDNSRISNANKPAYFSTKNVIHSYIGVLAPLFSSNDHIYREQDTMHQHKENRRKPVPLM